LNAEIPCITTVQAAVAAVQAIESIHGISEATPKEHESDGQGNQQPGQHGAGEDDRKPNASLMVAAIQDLNA
jgi:carbamoyl-phosphate synthase large chain